MNKINNKYGLIIEETKDPNAYKFGASPVPMEILQDDADWSDFLPVKEFQNLNDVEPYACVIFTILNCVETLIKRQYGEDRNYSDRFLACIVNTRGQGCSPHIACEFLRKIGVVPQELWPFDSSIDTEDKFFEKVPPKLYELAKEFNAEWDFKHDDVASHPDVISFALKCSPLLVSVPAWFERDGKYYRPIGVRDNHATTLYSQRVGEFRRIFDSYDKPAIKDLEWNCMPTVTKRFWIKRKIVKQSTYWFIDILKKILEAGKEILLLDKQILEKKTMENLTVKEQLNKAILESIGTDASPENLAPQDVSCAEGATKVLKKPFPDFPVILSTKVLKDRLDIDRRFTRTDNPDCFGVIISPMVGNINGHVGFLMGDRTIVSNSSATGTMERNYTWDSWIKKFKKEKGLRIFIYELNQPAQADVKIL